MTARPPSSLFAILEIQATVKVVDIGANPIDGDPPYAALLRAGHAEVVGFEPNRAALEALDRRKGPREIYLPHAVGDGRRHTLRHCQAPGMTSLLEPNPEVLALFHGFGDWGRVLRTEPVDTVRLDDIPETAGMDLLKVDVQGAELMVLDHAAERLAGAVVVQAEVEFLPMYRDQPLFAEIDQCLRRHGFALHRFEPLVSRVVKPLVLNNNKFAGFSQLLWADAIYVRDLTRLERLSPAKLLRGAVILHDCYRAYDVVLFLLLQLDRATGSAHAPRYLGALAQHAGVVARA